jgi:hypothetical protein
MRKFCFLFYQCRWKIIQILQYLRSSMHISVCKKYLAVSIPAKSWEYINDYF